MCLFRIFGQNGRTQGTPPPFFQVVLWLIVIRYLIPLFQSALFELGVLETDELDFFDFLCIQETLTTGTFGKNSLLQIKIYLYIHRNTVHIIMYVLPK